MTAFLALILRLMLAISLYAFLGWALYTIWMQIRINSLLISSRQIPGVVISPIDIETTTRREFNSMEVVLGRDPNCDFPINHETVSAHHAHLSYHHNQWWVEDLHSTNGSFLNGERLEVATVIITGDELRCGKTNFLITIKS
jgi:pSer/pThr/pTyr-binding forkhead associated (FHA) protein